jgi:hypothetical protein
MKKETPSIPPITTFLSLKIIVEIAPTTNEMRNKNNG